jgi:urocanate hydratase
MQFTTTQYTSKMTFQQIQQGIPSVLQNKTHETDINHAPKRKEILSSEEKKLALRNALRYFEPQHHAELIRVFRTGNLRTHLHVPFAS